MYQLHARIRGIAPLLQHRFGATTLDTLMHGANKRSGAPDYSMEWLTTMYATSDGWLFQPASHIEGCLVKTAGTFKIKGRAGKTYKDVFKTIFVSPEEIPHLWHGECIPAPTADLLTNPTENLSVSVMRVVVQRAAVARSRLMIAAGWELDFVISVNEEQLRPEVVQEILAEAGRSVGIGDYRPRYGRFEVVRFE